MKEIVNVKLNAKNDKKNANKKTWTPDAGPIRGDAMIAEDPFQETGDVHRLDADPRTVREDVRRHQGAELPNVEMVSQALDALDQGN